MFAIIIVSSIAVLLAWLSRFEKFKYGLELSFILLAFFMSIRYNFGNDYVGYLDYFKNASLFANFKNSIQSNQFEIGWNLLSFLFRPIGFFGMIIFLTIFEYFVIYKIIKRYVPTEWYGMAVFIFTFNVAHMLICASMMRQFLAMCIFLLSVDFIIQKKWIISIGLVLLASTFHTSAIILLPFCFVGFLKLNLSTKKVVIWFTVYLLVYFLATYVLTDLYYKIIALEQFEKYQYYLNQEKVVKGSGLGVLFSFIMFFFVLYTHKDQNEEIKTLFLLYSCAFLFEIFSDFTPIVVRLGYYFSILSIVCYPLILHKIENRMVKYALFLGYFLVTFKLFFDFYNPSGIWYKSYATYQTIFSAPLWF